MTISEVAKRAAIKLPPDVLMHPMPFPHRLDYAQKIIQEAINEETQLAREWNRLTEIELNNSRSLKYDLENHLRAVIEHIAPMLRMYEPNMPEHPVITSIRDYLEA